MLQSNSYEFIYDRTHRWIEAFDAIDADHPTGTESHLIHYLLLYEVNF